LVENYSRGTLDHLGVGYDWLQEVNPQLVYCSLTGYGSEDNLSPAKAMDTIIQAESGVMYTSGGPEDPPVRIGIPMADLCAPMFGAIGILAAMHQALRTGIGQHIDVSMLGALTMMVSGEPLKHLHNWSVPVYRRQKFGTQPPQPAIPEWYNAVKPCLSRIRSMVPWKMSTVWACQSCFPVPASVLINRLRNWVNTMIWFIAKFWVTHQKKFRN
jgi:hypothetical protein